MLYRHLDSPLGPLLLTRQASAGGGAAAGGITGLFLPTGRNPRQVAPGWVRADGAFGDIAAQLGEYFAGGRFAFDLPLAPRGSAFQLRVWQALRAIPYGETTSYGAIARSLGVPEGARAVGLANGQNPISIVVPCHRVIGADGSLTGYGGGLPAKQWLLAHEAAHSGLFAAG